jgi:beta-lactamase class A
MRRIILALFLSCVLSQLALGSPAHVAAIDRSSLFAGHWQEAVPRDLVATTQAVTPPELTGLARQILRYLATRHGVKAVAVDDLFTGQELAINPTARFDTASIVKVAIMATLMWQSERSLRPLGPATRALMVPMIEESDNTDATILWNQAGGPAAIAAFVHRAGMTATTPNVAWGLTTTTAPNQLKLIAQLALPPSLLTPANQAYALALMDHVVGWEAWGVTGGVPAGVTVSLKNGWLPLPGRGWEVNSIGYVHGDGKAYTIAVLTQGNPTMGYGVETIDTVSAMVWQALYPGPQGGGSGGSGARWRP